MNNKNTRHSPNLPNKSNSLYTLVRFNLINIIIYY